MTLEPGKENWKGYFLDETLDPWQAINQTWADEYLQKIQTRDWTMIKECPQGGESCFWRANSIVTPFQYGDLVILVTDTDQPITDFVWAIGEETEDFEEIPDPVFYSYEEQADYIPFYIEFDSTSTVQEIAIIADGDCYGAAVRNPGDTVIELNGYFEGLPPGTPLEFETWDGFKSAKINRNGYVVQNNDKWVLENRTIYIGEPKDYYVVSFKHDVVNSTIGILSETGSFPNPFTNSVTIAFQLNETSPVWLELLDMNGKIVETLVEGELFGGYYEYSWQGTNNKGEDVQDGIYFYHIRTGKGT